MERELNIDLQDIQAPNNISSFNRQLESYQSTNPQSQEYIYTNTLNYPIIIILKRISHIRLLEIQDHTDIQINDVSIRILDNNNNLVETIYHSYNNTDYNFNNQRVVLEPNQKLRINMYNHQVGGAYKITARLSLLADLIL